jgi:hypothetical protein
MAATRAAFAYVSEALGKRDLDEVVDAYTSASGAVVILFPLSSFLFLFPLCISVHLFADASHVIHAHTQEMIREADSIAAEHDKLSKEVKALRVEQRVAGVSGVRDLTVKQAVLCRLQEDDVAERASLRVARR